MKRDSGPETKSLWFVLEIRKVTPDGMGEEWEFFSRHYTPEEARRHRDEFVARGEFDRSDFRTRRVWE